MFDMLDGLYAFAAAIAATISGWIVTRKVQQRMKKTMGRKATDLELASIKTWMEVEQEEKLNEAVRSIHPK
jgi:hypothetical protein